MPVSISGKLLEKVTGGHRTDGRLLKTVWVSCDNHIYVAKDGAGDLQIVFKIITRHPIGHRQRGAIYRTDYKGSETQSNCRTCPCQVR